MTEQRWIALSVDGEKTIADPIAEFPPRAAIRLLVFSAEDLAIVPKLAAHAGPVTLELYQADPATIQEIAKLGEDQCAQVRHLIFGATDPIQSYHLGTPGALKQTLSGVMRLKDSGIDQVGLTIVTRSNYRHLDAIPALLKRLGISKWLIAPPLLREGRERDQWKIVPRFALIQPYLKQAVKKTAEDGLAIEWHGWPDGFGGDASQRKAASPVWILSREHHREADPPLIAANDAFCSRDPKNPALPKGMKLGPQPLYLERFGGLEFAALAEGNKQEPRDG